MIMKFGNFMRSFLIEVFERRIVSFNDDQFFPIPRKIFNALFFLFFLFY